MGQKRCQTGPEVFDGFGQLVTHRLGRDPHNPGNFCIGEAVFAMQQKGQPPTLRKGGDGLIQSLPKLFGLQALKAVGLATRSMYGELQPIDLP